MPYCDIRRDPGTDVIHSQMEFLPEAIRNHLLKDWLLGFCTDVFPLIDPEPYKVLFESDSGAYCYPVNIMIAFLILKEILQISYDDLRLNGYTDLKVRLALHLFDYVPKDGSLSRNIHENFRIGLRPW